MEQNRGLLALEFGRAQSSSSNDPFEALAAEWRVWGYRLALKITGCPDAAADALQNALVRSFKARKQLESAASPRAWFRKTLVRCALDQRSKTVTPADPAGHIDMDPGDTLQVRHTLAKLTAAHRAILALAIGEGLTYDEIAELLDIPSGTVGSRLHLAKAAFRKAWGED